MSGGKALIERVETRRGLQRLSHMKELGMGSDRYTLIDFSTTGTTRQRSMAQILPERFCSNSIT